jgi:hypothetical protein
MSDLLRRIETYLDGRGDVATGRFLSGRGVFLDGRLVAAVIGEDLCLRLGEDRWQELSGEDAARQFLFADQPVKGWVLVDGDRVAADDELSAWLEAAL